MKGIIIALKGIIQKPEVFLYNVEELYIFSAKLVISSLFVLFLER